MESSNTSGRLDSMDYEIGIIGRGIAALTLARRLAETGKSVCVIGPRAKQGSASVAALGMNVLRGVRDARDPLHIVKVMAYQRFKNWLQQLATEAQESIPQDFSAIYEPIFTTEELSKFQKRDEALRKTESRACNISVKSPGWHLPNELLQELERNLAGFIEYPEDGWFGVLSVLAALEKILHLRKVELLEQEVVKISPESLSGWILTTSSAGLIKCREVAVACGVFAEPLLEELGITLPFRKVGGMVLELETPGSPDGILLSRRKNYVSHGGRSWVGALDFKNVNSSFLPIEEFNSGIDQLEEMRSRNFGDLGTTPFRTLKHPKYSYGVRSFFNDRMPAVGMLAISDTRRLFLSLGYHKNGLQIADICAENLVKLMFDHQVDSVFHSFSPARLLK
jgi:glycine/D-amino acid oxidase-like deaminating enzyme